MRMSVLVLWTGMPNGHRIVRSLRDAGFRVVAAHPEGHGGGRGWGHLRPLRYPPVLTDPDAFVAWVARTCDERGIHIVLPVDEDITRVLAFRRSALGDVRVVGPTATQYDALANKGRLAAATAALDLPTPVTVEVDDLAADRTGWPAVPCMVKPRTSGSEIDAPQRVGTEAERDALVERLVASGHGAVLQELIEGQRWVVQSVRGPGVFEHVVHRVDLEWPRGCGLATVKRPFRGPQAAVDAARALLDAVDYHGPSGISVIERDGLFYAHDVNLRLGATTGASVNAGFDFPRRAVQAALDLPGTAFDGRMRPGAVHMRLDKEVEAVLDAVSRRRPRVVLARLRRIARVGLNPAGMLDPSPFNVFFAGHLASRLTRRSRPHASPQHKDTPADADAAPPGAPPVAPRTV